MTPNRCSVPEESTKPSGSVNSTSVRSKCAGCARAISQSNAPYPEFKGLLDPVVALVREHQLLHRDFVAIGFASRTSQFRRPTIDELPLGHRFTRGVVHGDGAVGAGLVNLPLFDQLAPLPHVHAVG